MNKAVFLGFNALGDTLCTTPVLRSFRSSNPGTFIICVVQNAGFCRVLDGNPHIDLVLYSEWMYIHGLTRYNDEWVRSLPLDLDEPVNLYRFDIGSVCSTAEAFREHISKGFSRLLGIPIDSIKPVVRLSDEDRRIAARFSPRPYVVFSMHSVANPPRTDGDGRVKDWPSENFDRLARHLHSSGFDVIAVGAEGEARAGLPYVRDLYGLPIKVVAALLENATCVVTLENGVAHLAAAVDAPTVELYSTVVPLEWANPAESPRARVIYDDLRNISCDQVIAEVESTIGCRKTAV